LGYGAEGVGNIYAGVSGRPAALKPMQQVAELLGGGD